MTDAWFTTYTGKVFNPTECQLDDICIEDIAHSLSNTCRYGGHCKTLYSVAEHCERLTLLVPPSLKIHALLHDAPEALTGCGDVVSMMKHNVFPVIGTLEQILHIKIYQKFRLRFMTAHDKQELSEAEDILLATEVRDLMHESCRAYWPLSALPKEDIIMPWNPIYAEYRYLERFKGLMECQEGGKPK